MEYLRKMVKKVINRKRLNNDLKRFEMLATSTHMRFDIDREQSHPYYNDAKSASFDRHYVLHPAWACRVLAQTRPAIHVDISSSVRFVAMASAFVRMKHYDYLPADISLSNLSVGKADVVALPFDDSSLLSLSCMHVVEHIGLGRYGDPLDYDGDLKAIGELKRVMAKKGNLLFVVPVGKPRIVFNGHRIYGYNQIIEYFGGMELKEFALITDRPDDNSLHYGSSRELVNEQNYGCGCFWFIKN
jgi:SAM-dependent methyltransferase